MIKVIIKEKEIVIKGHALHDEYGKDIVCASVSAIAITSCNAILSIEDTISCKEDAGLLEIKILKSTDINKKILDNMIDLLKELSLQYPKNIEIRNEE